MKLTPFKNEPLSDFKGNSEHLRTMKAALEEVRQELGQEHALVIGGQRINTEEKFSSYNPARKGEVVGVFSKANAKLAERAILTADETFRTWGRAPVEARVELLVAAA